MSDMATRQVVVSAPGVVTLQEASTPTPGPGEVRMRMSAVGVCGSDVHALHGRHPTIALPYQPGHEIVGIVDATAPDVDIPVGTRAIIDPIAACGNCKYCRDGRYNICATVSFFGCSTPTGGLADYFTIRADQVVTVPPELSDVQAVLIEPLATPVHAVRLAGPDLTGKTVAILGAGTIGLLTLAVARRCGAQRIAMSDVSEVKRRLARRLGADSVHDAASPDMVSAIRDDLGTSADIVFDCVSVQATVDQAVELATKGGTVVVVGVPPAPVTVALPTIQDLQIRLQGSATYTRHDFGEAMDMLRAGLVRPEDFVTARYPLTKVAEAFDDAAGGQQVKVVVLADDGA